MRRQTKSDCQAGPVSQDQICQRKHDVEFCFLFLKPSVSGFLKFEQTLYNTEDMFDLGTHGRLCVFPFLCLVLTAFAVLADFAGATVDLIPDLFAGFVSYFGIFSLRCAEVPAVSVECIFLSVHEFGCHGHIGYIGCRSLNSVNNTAVPVHTNMCLISEMPGVAFPRLMGVGIALLFLVFRGRWNCYNRRIYDRSLFQNEATLHQYSNHLCKQLLLQSVLHQLIPKASQSISVGYLVTGIYPAKLRKCATVYDLPHRAFI